MSKNLTSKTGIVLVLTLMFAANALAQQRASTGSGASSTRSSQQTDATTVFRSARDLITDGDWSKAQDKFDEYVKAYPNEKNIDAALYWLAYTQQKLARYDQCRETILRLLEKYPTSTWREDARLLLAQVPGTYVMAAQDLENALRVRGPMALPAETIEAAAAAVEAIEPVEVEAPVAVTAVPGMAVGAGGGRFWRLDDQNGSDSADGDPCEFKIVVLQALFQTDLQRGIMAATDWLKPGSTQTVRCKGAALTLLGRNGGKAVTPVILGVARSEPDLKLRARAISALGVSNDDTVVDALRDFALNSQEDDIVEASVYALSKHTGERAIVVLSDVALKGKTMPQRRLAITSIATRPGEPAVDALFRIYDADQSPEIRKIVIAGFANRRSERARTRLLEIARSSDNIELRKAAISAISRRGGDQAIDFLISLYDNEKNEELRDQIFNSLASGSNFYYTPVVTPGPGGQTSIGYTPTSRMNDQRVIQKLIEVAKDQKAPMERRKRAIGLLSRSKDPKVLEFLQELLR